VAKLFRNASENTAINIYTIKLPDAITLGRA